MKRILVIEDDAEFAEIMRMRLESAGYAVSVAGDAYLGASEAIKQSYDLVILDLGMPMGGGETVLRRIRAVPAKAALPVIIVTGKDEQRDLERLARDYNVAVIFVKPYDPVDFLETIAAALGSGAG